MSQTVYHASDRVLRGVENPHDIRSGQELSQAIQSGFLNLANALFGDTEVSPDVGEGFFAPAIAQAESANDHCSCAIIELAESPPKHANGLQSTRTASTASSDVSVEVWLSGICSS